MRVKFASVLLLSIGLLTSHGLSSGASAEEAATPVGVARVNVPGTPLFDTLVWYPAKTEEPAWRIGPFPMPAGKDAPIADGRFPVVLLSHGGGPTGGTPLILRELASSLARQGFIVISPFHGKTRFLARTAQMKAALEAVAQSTEFTDHADLTKLSIMGFSLGTAVALELAGAVPDFGELAAYCEATPTDKLSCSGGPSDGGRAEGPGVPSGGTTPDLPRITDLKALVLLDPFSVPFAPESLTDITVPVLAVRPKASALGEANLERLRAKLPHQPEVLSVPGGHFIFADQCPQVLAQEAPAVCKDASGIDRAKVHEVIETEVGRFLKTWIKTTAKASKP